MKLILLIFIVGTSSICANAQDCDQIFQTKMLELHNSKRALHKSPALTTSEELVGVAKNWASHLAESEIGLQHQQNMGMGENLAFLGGSRCTSQCEDCATKMFSLWYDEKNLFDYSSGDFSPETGHFTQLVWLSTKELGCGLSCKGDTCYSGCNYKPSGNVQGQYRENVLKDD